MKLQPYMGKLTGNSKKIYRGLNVMKEIGVYPDVKVFNMIIEMHCENKKCETC